jgi:hypothetical protein
LRYFAKLYLRNSHRRDLTILSRRIFLLTRIFQNFIWRWCNKLATDAKILVPFGNPGSIELHSHSLSLFGKNPGLVALA